MQAYFNWIKNFIRHKPLGSCIGLDIQTSQCKMVELKKEGLEFELVSWAIERVDKGDFISAIKKILSHVKTPSSFLHTALYGKGTLIRYISLPRMTREDLKNAFAFEADKYFPFAQDQIYTDCYILDPQGKDKQMSVMATAATREIVDQRIKMFDQVGVDCELISINSVALANIINVFGDTQPSKEVFAIFDLGETVSNITIIVDKLPRFSRDIFIGIRDFIKMTSNSMGVEFDKAERLIFDPGDREKEVLSACESTIMNIIQELRLSFDYFSTEKNTEVGQLFLIGDGAKLLGIYEVIGSHLDVKAQLWNPFEFIKINDVSVKKIIDGHAHQLGGAVGLALYGHD